MILSYGEYAPDIHREAWVAEDATICGDVTLDAGVRIMHGARVVAEAGSSIRIGKNSIVLENAVIRATALHDCEIGDHCVVGPNSHIVGAKIEDEVFIATGASVFHGARLGRGSEVRINGTVHLRTVLQAGETVPIGWVAVGDTAHILPAERHAEIWDVQRPLDFPGFVYGVDRNAPGVMQSIAQGLSRSLARHREERVVPGVQK